MHGNAHESFTFDDYNIEDIKDIVLRISSAQSTVLFYKKLIPVFLIKRKEMLLVKRDRRMEMVNGDIIRISSGFDLMILNREVYINGFFKFEKSFDFEQIAIQKMTGTVQRILDMELVDDSKSYLSDLKVVKRHLLRAGSSEVFGVNKEIIISFAQNKNALLGLNVKDGKIVLNSHASVTNFLKLLNNDFLWSELTLENYDALAKNKLEVN